MRMGDEAASAAAKAGLEAELRFAAAETRRQALLTASAQDRLKTYLQGYRNVRGEPDVFDATLNLLESFGNGTVSIRGRFEAITALAHGELADVLQAFRRTAVLGRRMNRPLADDVAREIHGQGSGSAEAKAMADAVSSVFEALRNRYNAAGGNIAKLDNYLPHAHEAEAVHRAGFDAWFEFIRPRLAPEKMIDPLTGERGLSGSRFEQLLRGAYENITTGGWVHREPSKVAFGRGALANQRQEHRFLVFKDADSWLEYDRQFGKGDPVVSVFQHIKGMAKDIATLETLGPNPGAMVEWLKQVNAREFARFRSGQPSLYREGNAAQEFAGGSAEYLMNRIQAVFDYQRGRAVVSNGVVNVMGSVRNVITSAALGGGAVTAAATDPFIDGIARQVSGLPIWPAFTAIFKTFSSQTREQAVRSGLLMEDFLHIVRDEGRFVSISTTASEWTRWLADRSLTWTGLTPITEARRHVLGLEWQGALADHARLSWDLLPERLRSTMERYGLNSGDWEIIRFIPQFSPGQGSAGLIRPIDIAKYDRPTAEKVLGMIYGQMERHIPSGTSRSKSIVTGNQPRGSVPGELLESMLQFKSFGLSFTTLQIEALQQEMARGKWNGAAYAGSLALALTIGGGLALQLSNITQGKDPQPVNDPKFVLAAMQRGGGFGLFGDFMFSDVNRLGGGFGQAIMGPTIGAFSDLGKLTIGNVQELAQGKDTKAAREGINFAGRYTPILSSAWPVRAAYRRVFLDQLQHLADPDAHRAFTEQQARFQREAGGTFFWPPGQMAPDRPPSLDRVLK